MRNAQAPAPARPFINFAPSPRVTLYAVPASEAADNGGDAYVAAEGRVHLGRYAGTCMGSGGSCMVLVPALERAWLLWCVCLVCASTYLPVCACSACGVMVLTMMAGTTGMDRLRIV